MKRTILVYDQDERYAKNLVQALSHRREGSDYQILTVFDEDSLATYLSEHQVHLLLVAPDLATERVLEMNVRQIALLTAMRDAKTEQFPNVYKYQPVKEMASSVMECCNMGLGAHAMKEFACNQLLNQGIESVTKAVVGVFVPGRLAMTKTDITALSKKRNCRGLYISLEFFSEFLEGTKKAGRLEDLSDVIYLWKQGKLQKGLSMAVASADGYDYLPAIGVPEDLVELRSFDLIQFLKDIIQICGYEEVWIGFGVFGFDQGLLYELCDSFEMILPKEQLASLKRTNETYRRYLSMLKMEDRIRHTSILIANSDGSVADVLSYDQFGREQTQ